MTPRARLIIAVQETLRPVPKIEGALRLFNDPEWPDQIWHVVHLAREFNRIHGIDPDDDIATNYAGLAGVIAQIDWPPPAEADDEWNDRLGELEGQVGRLQSATLKVLKAAQDMGIRPARVELPQHDGILAEKAGRGRELRGLALRLDAVEKQLQDGLAALPVAGQPRQQVVIITRYVTLMRTNIATIRAALTVGPMLDLSVLERAATTMGKATGQIITTVRAAASKANETVRAAAEAMKRPVRAVVRGAATLVKRVLRAEEEEIEAEPLPPIPEDFLEQAHEMILAGKAPPAHWVPLIETLSLSGTDLSDLRPLSGLSALTTLRCWNTKVSDLSPLSGLSALTALHCWDTQVNDLSPLSGLSALTTLYCWGTQVSDLAPLSGLSALTTLRCWNTLVSDLSPLSGLSALTMLDCSYTGVSDLAPLSTLSALTMLDCSYTQVSDLSPLLGLSALRTLDCSGTQVSDLAPLRALNHLKTLGIRGLPCVDLDALSRLTALQRLRLDGCEASDLSPLAGLRNLERLDLCDWPFADISVLSDLPNLSINVESDERAAALASTLAPGSAVTVQLAYYRKAPDRYPDPDAAAG